jgi:hypothetical protein
MEERQLVVGIGDVWNVGNFKLKATLTEFGRRVVTMQSAFERGVVCYKSSDLTPGHIYAG